MFLFYIIIILSISSSLIYTQDINKLNITCKHYCDRIHVAQQGNVYWTNETYIDDNKQFLRLEFLNFNNSQKLNLSLSLKEFTKNDSQSYEFTQTQLSLQQTEKVNIIFNCLMDVTLQFELFVYITEDSKQNLTIPFQKQCTSYYYDNQKISIKLKNQADSNFSKNWSQSQAQLIENSLTNYFELIPEKNCKILYNKETLYFNSRQLLLDKDNEESAKQLIKKYFIAEALPFATEEKPLNLQPYIICKNISDQKIKFNFNLTSTKFDEFIIIPFFFKCSTMDIDVNNNQEFPIHIGTSQKSSEIYSAGTTQNFTTIIPENRNEFKFFLQMKSTNETLTKQLLFPNKQMTIQIIAKAEDDIIKIKQLKNLTIDKVFNYKLVILQFECLEQGKTKIDVDVNFLYGRNESKLAQFTLNKTCGKVTLKTEKTLFGEIVYYIVCIIAMLFGVQTIRLFTNLIKQDANVPEITIDTSYKKEYKKVEEEQQIEL